jgi:glycerol uptake facilitator-like aquaporin
VGTALLLATVVGSGIMGEQLAGGNVAIALLANSLATGGALIALILTFGPVSGAHFNPVVTAVERVRGAVSTRELTGYIAAQLGGAVIGVVVAHAMFGQRLFQTSGHVRSGLPQAFSEVVATFGLVTVIVSCARSAPANVPYAVGAYITAAYWFTASTSFANPAVTVARALTDTFAGIRPADVPLFVAAQLIGAAIACVLSVWLEAKSAIPRR